MSLNSLCLDLAPLGDKYAILYTERLAIDDARERQPVLIDPMPHVYLSCIHIRSYDMPRV